MEASAYSKIQTNHRFLNLAFSKKIRQEKNKPEKTKNKKKKFASNITPFFNSTSVLHNVLMNWASNVSSYCDIFYIYYICVHV